MKRISRTFSLTNEDYTKIKSQMLNWANQFSIFIFLDNNDYQNNRYHFYECLLAVNPIAFIHANSQNDTLTDLQQWHQTNGDWLFGHINYDYKNQLVSKLVSSKQKAFEFSEISFFCPETVCYITNDKMSLVVETVENSPDKIFDSIIQQIPEEPSPLPTLNFQKKISRDVYLETLKQLKEHIKNGDCYEINFCNEGFVENVSLNPLDVFKRLNEVAPSPFATFYKHKDQYLICSSPERYLCKKDDKIISQPIKGTIKRSEDIAKDELLKQTLYGSVKDRAENVMIVDLTRNDLSRSCETGSIIVEELFGIYSYPSVHQMISTVCGTLEKETPFTNAIRHSFPMGSMTGAPKVKVMELIEKYERSRRELFSGTIGYITPNADFDFNVIIRSLFYNEQTKYLSYQTGGAITYDSDPEKEWEEMQLKAYNLEKLFQH